MAISTGEIVSSTDLNNSFTGSLNIIITDVATPPALYWVNLKFDEINSSTPEAGRRKEFVLPDDYIMEEAYLSIGNMRSAITASFDGTNLVKPFSIAGSGSVTNVFYSFPRYFSSGSQPQQMLLKGSSVSVYLETNFTGSGNMVSVGFGLRTYRRID